MTRRASAEDVSSQSDDDDELDVQRQKYLQMEEKARAMKAGVRGPAPQQVGKRGIRTMADIAKRRMPVDDNKNLGKLAAQSDSDTDDDDEYELPDQHPHKEAPQPREEEEPEEKIPVPDLSQLPSRTIRNASPHPPKHVRVPSKGVLPVYDESAGSVVSTGSTVYMEPRTYDDLVITQPGNYVCHDDTKVRSIRVQNCRGVIIRNARVSTRNFPSLIITNAEVSLINCHLDSTWLDKEYVTGNADMAKNGGSHTVVLNDSEFSVANSMLSLFSDIVRDQACVIYASGKENSIQLKETRVVVKLAEHNVQGIVICLAESTVASVLAIKVTGSMEVGSGNSVYFLKGDRNKGKAMLIEMMMLVKAMDTKFTSKFNHVYLTESPEYKVLSARNIYEFQPDVSGTPHWKGNSLLANHECKQGMTSCSDTMWGVDVKNIGSLFPTDSNVRLVTGDTVLSCEDRMVTVSGKVVTKALSLKLPLIAETCQNLEIINNSAFTHVIKVSGSNKIMSSGSGGVGVLSMNLAPKARLVFVPLVGSNTWKVSNA